MASGDTQAIDIIEVESAITSKTTDISSSGKDVELDEYGKFIRETPGKFVISEAMPSSDQTSTPGGLTQSRPKSDRERKIGHRRVGEGGEITYKKIQTSQIMGSIQLGIQHTVGKLASKPKRDLLMMDFWELETISFPPEGTNITTAHHYSEFRFKIYAPIAFRYFRDLFGIQPDDFMMSMCLAPLRELSNPGASGSIFYLTDDDEFIIKTVQHKEGEFLQKLLPGYYMNLNQNPRTLLPKFFGLYCYQCNSKNVRLIAMNNLLPSYIKMHQKYDLKGSTYKRKASKAERQKRSPTYKDLDFMEHHPNGIFLEADTCNALMKTIQRDCRVLESFKIMDYSLLLGIHNLDLALKEKQEEKEARVKENVDSDYEDAPEADQQMQQDRERGTVLNRSRSINRQRLVAHSTAMESIQAESEPIDEEEDVPPGGIPARSEKGERLLLFIGVIDILQSYRLKKKLEHTWKSIIHDGDTVSVHRPSFYAQRFQDFMAKTVFKKIPSPLKHSPSKRKSLSKAAATKAMEAEADREPVAGSSNQNQPQYPHHHHHHHHHHHTGTPKSDYSSNDKTSALPTITTSSTSSASYPIRSNLKSSATSSSAAIPPLKKKTSIVKQSVPPPVPPRGSPKVGNKSSSSIAIPPCTPPRKRSSAGTSPSCSSTPPPAFDDISDHGGSHRNSADDKNTTDRRSTSNRSDNYREDSISISDIRLDPSTNSNYGSRGALAWTPPASVEGSTPTWTEGTPSFTDSSSSGDMAFSGDCSPLHTIPDRDSHKPTVEKALNSLTSEMVSISNVNNSKRATVVNVQKSHKQIIYIKSNAGNIIGNISNVDVQQTISQCTQIIEREE